MGLLHRKLIPEICETICHVEQQPCSSDCRVCLKFCLTNPQPYSFSQPPPPPPYFSDESGSQGRHSPISTYLVLAYALIASAFFIVCCSVIYTRFFSRRRVPSIQQTPGARDEDFMDEEHGPIVDHPIWYIRTPGLQNSVIGAITVFNYKKGESLIEGTECSVCLSEFMEDESLRLLPKCNHAFHLPCIDTWLRSHTNCPLCRAPIVANNNPAGVRVPSMELEPSNVVVDSTSLENNHNMSNQLELMEISQNSGESENIGGMGNSVPELEIEDGGTRVLPQIESTVEEVVVIRPRRSVSPDSCSVANINLALASVLPGEPPSSDSNRALGGADQQIVSKRVAGNGNLAATSSKRSSSFRIRYLHSVVPSSLKRSRSYNGKYLLSWYGRNNTQKKPNATLRSS